MMTNYFSSMMGGWGGMGFGGIFGLLFWVGFIFLIVWAYQHLKKEQLLGWGTALIVVAIIGWLLTAGFGGSSASRYDYKKGWAPGMMGFGQGMMMGGMMQCVRDEECFSSMNQMMNRMNQWEKVEPSRNNPGN